MKRTAEAKRIRLPVLAMRTLDALYAGLPKLECKRLCSECCGPILMGAVEWDRIIARLGYRPTPTEQQASDLDCPMLKNGECSVYSIRPAICRLWGLVPSMRCPHGCEPERVLTEAEAHEFMRAVDACQAEYASR